MVSPVDVKMRSQPEGAVQAMEMVVGMVGTNTVLVRKGVGVCATVGVSLTIAETVNVAVGISSEIVGGMVVGVACDGKVSARASEIPPITKITETRAMMTPPPNCRKDCIISPLYSWQLAKAR
jgi:hypothetical protein